MRAYKKINMQAISPNRLHVVLFYNKTTINVISAFSRL